MTPLPNIRDNIRILFCMSEYFTGVKRQIMAGVEKVITAIKILLREVLNRSPLIF